MNNKYENKKYADCNNQYFSELEQTISATERTFLKLLVSKLIQKGLYKEIRHNCFLVCPLKENKYCENPRATLRDNSHRPFKALRPDFLLPHFGLVIEIDGSAHDRIDSKIEKDIQREVLLHNLDLHLYRVDAEMVSSYYYKSDPRIHTVINDIVKLCQILSTCPAEKKRISKVKQKTLKYQKLIEQDHNYQAFSPRESMDSRDLSIPGSCQIHYGGYIYRP